MVWLVGSSSCHPRMVWKTASVPPLLKAKLHGKLGSFLAFSSEASAAAREALAAWRASESRHSAACCAACL